MFSITVEGLDELLTAGQRLANDLSRECKDSVMEAATQGAQAAKSGHTFTNRSFKLENAIKAYYVGGAKPDAPPIKGLEFLDNTVANDTSATGWHWAKMFAGKIYASFVEEGTRPHPIERRKASALAWQGPDGMVFAKRVNHPGTKPQPFMKLAAEKAASVLPDDLESRVNRVCAAFR